MANIVSGAYDALKSFAKQRELESNLRDSYKFADRRNKADTVVIILAGYKRPLWPKVFSRLERAMPDNVDVCVMTAGLFDQDLSDMSERNGWSYLSTRTNDVSLVQNVAISLHPHAKTLVKIDEDIFVTTNTLSDTLAHYHHLRAAGIVDAGFVSPMLNVNGVCYRPLLTQLELLEAFEAQFGVARIATLGIAATDDAAAARWIWERTAPLEQTVARLRRTQGPGLLTPVQFSIGLVVMPRDFWETIGYLPVKRHMLAMKKSTLGADEERICRMATFLARPGVVCEHALAGHFSFGRQYQGMLKFFEERPDLF
jgi:hypothetical protein